MLRKSFILSRNLRFINNELLPNKHYTIVTKLLLLLSEQHDYDMGVLTKRNLHNSFSEFVNYCQKVNSHVLFQLF